MAGYVVNQIVQKLRSEAEKHAGILLFGVRVELAYVTDELASMSAFLDEAGVGERARVKREWIRQVRELAHDAEDCIDEFRRRLVQPTDQEIVGRLLRTRARLLRASGADTHFLSRLLSASFRAGTHFLRRAGCARMLGTRGPTTRFRRISARLLPTGAGIELGTRALRMGTRLLRTGNARYWLAVEVQRIKAGVDEACRRAQKFGFISTPSNAAAASATGRAGDLSLHPYRLSAFFTQDSELVGIEEHRDNLIKILLDEDMEQTRVISVVGCAGLGKTTLVRRVFENQRIFAGGGRFGHFDCRAWITVSSSFELMAFLRKVFHGLSLGGFNQELGAVQLIEDIRAYLRDKRYVIIFDDVWTLDAWKTIELVFPVNTRGSRIVVTTRNEKVAYTCCAVNNGYVYKPPSLSPEQSMRLFCRRVFEGHPCPGELEALSTKILKKCGGVPLLIGAIAGILAGKPTKTADDWKCMLDHLGSGLTNYPDLDGAMQIMALSYDALPSHLKRCFLYLSIYPEDYVMETEDLQALWIAEGLVRHSGEITLEELAESYFNELICRNLIKVGKINERTGKVRTCLVHDVMHAFAVTKSAEEENLVALSGKHNIIFPQGAIRHLSIHTSENLLLLHDNIELDHLRSLLFMSETESYEPPPHSHKVLSFICRSRFLRVLDLRGLEWLTASHIEEIGTLYHLEYLNLPNTGIKRIPESFGNLQNLETLDARSYWHPNIVPAAVVDKLPKLRHLSADRIEAPQGRCWSWKTLVTLDCLCLQDGSEGAFREMRNLTQLRKLGVKGLRPTQGTDFCAALSEMSSHLRCLKVEFDAGDTVGYLDSLASPPLLLQHLQLDGFLCKLPVWISSNSLEAVSTIHLSNTRLQFDAIQTLQKLPNLIELSLEDDAYIGKELHLNGDGFSRLSSLRLWNVPLESLDFGVGSVPRLEVLGIYYCDSLREIGKFDGENLPGLKRIYYEGMVAQKENQVLKRICQMQLLKESLEAHPFMFVRNVFGFVRDLPKPREM